MDGFKENTPFQFNVVCTGEVGCSKFGPDRAKEALPTCPDALRMRRSFCTWQERAHAHEQTSNKKKWKPTTGVQCLRLVWFSVWQGKLDCTDKYILALMLLGYILIFDLWIVVVLVNFLTIIPTQMKANIVSQDNCCGIQSGSITGSKVFSFLSFRLQHEYESSED